MQGMVIQMNDEQFLTLAQLQAFLDGTLAVDFSVLPAERYSIIARTITARLRLMLRAALFSGRSAAPAAHCSAC
jgi:hypothetical protein